MSSRPLIAPYAVIKNGDMSADITSEASIIQNVSMLSYQITWSGTAPVGEVQVQVSNDFRKAADGSIINAGTWTVLMLSAPTLVSGNTGNGFIDVTATGAYAIRLVYLADTGVGTMQATITAKVA